jgi:aspartate kinase
MRAPRPQATRLTVVKVGGSLLAGKADLLRVASAIADRRRDGGLLLVVASALKGVTDLLELAAIQAMDRRLQRGHLGETLEGLRQRHLEIARDIAGDRSILDRLRGALDDVETLVGSVRATGELSDATYARLLSCGERLSVILLAAAVQAAGHEARPVTAEEAGLRAGGPPRAGFSDLPASAAGLRRMRRHLCDRVLVLTGFYGVDGDGGVVLFGRGGSDDTACAVAAGLDADRLELWKDVPGFMSADPHEVRGARVIEEISFDEVAQLGAYGSRIVHHGCLAPLRGRSTELFISSIPGAGSATGTMLVERSHRGAPRVVALASRKGRNEFRLDCGPRDGAHELAGRVLNTLADAQIPVGTFDTERSTVRFVVAGADADADRVKLVLSELTNGCEIGIRRSPALIGAVGDGVAEDVEIRSRMLSCLAATGVRCDRATQPSGRSGLSCTVHQEDLAAALSGLHDHFFTPAEPSHPS